MKLSFHQKEIFYHELGELVRSGATFTSAINTLSEDTPERALRRFMRRLRKAVTEGRSVGDAFREQPGAAGEMEASIIAACEAGGRLDEGCRYLSRYFGNLERARGAFIKSSLYPVFVLHLGVFLFALPDIVVNGNVKRFLTETVGVLLAIYVVSFVVFLIVRFVVNAAEYSTLADGFCQAVPVAGGLRRALALERFSATYDMQLRAGILVYDSLDHAARASRSARIIAAIREITPRVHRGEQVGQLLSGRPVFPKNLVRAIRIGEETGALDRELARMTEYFAEKAASRMALVSEWAGRLLYLAIALFIGYRIVTTYQEIYSGLGKSLDM